MKEIEASLRIEIEKIRGDVEKYRMEIKETEARITVEILRSHNRVIIWVAGLLFAQATPVVALQKLLHFS